MNACVYIGSLTILAILISEFSYGASLSGERLEVAAGTEQVRMDFSLSVGSGEGVASFQFDLLFDAALMQTESLYIGPAATAAVKYLNVSWQGDGHIRGIVLGLNQTTIASGVVFYALFSLSEEIVPGEHGVLLENVVLSSPTGRQVPGSAAGGSIVVLGVEGEGEGEGEGRVEGEGEGLPGVYHSADYNPADWKISISELLRLIQLFNYNSYSCDANGEDGYSAEGNDKSCTPHSSDYYPQDWSIALSELLRMIQFYNFKGYHPASETEDGYDVGLPEK